MKLEKKVAPLGLRKCANLLQLGLFQNDRHLHPCQNQVSPFRTFKLTSLQQQTPDPIYLSAASWYAQGNVGKNSLIEI